jgi:hypothetical protein
MTCKKAQKFLGQCHTAVTETVNATKVRYGEDDALKLLHGIEKLIVAKEACGFRSERGSAGR